MNIKALKESLNEAKEAKKELLKNAIETRSLVQDETKTELNNKISDLQNQIEKAEEEIRNSSVEENIENKGENKMTKHEQEIRSIEKFI